MEMYDKNSTYKFNVPKIENGINTIELVTGKVILEDDLNIKIETIKGETVILSKSLTSKSKQYNEQSRYANDKDYY